MGRNLNDVSQCYGASQGPHFSPHSTAKTNDKSTFFSKSDVVSPAVHSEKTRPKKLMMRIMIIIMNKSHEMTAFSGLQKLTSANEK